MAPVPNVCHQAECNPATGICDPLPDPSKAGQLCLDSTDLCTVNKQCDGQGQCVGGAPKCHYLDHDCVHGHCDANTGECSSVQLSPGDHCRAGDSDCTNGLCMAGNICDPQPSNEGGPCDSDGCMVAQTCAAGACQGGTAITSCLTGDDCCPLSCTAHNDGECGATFSGDFVPGQAAVNECGDWNDFQLTLQNFAGTINEITIRGKPAGSPTWTSSYTCTGAAATSLCDALANDSLRSEECAGETWRVWPCSGGTELHLKWDQVPMCSCSATGVVGVQVRPCGRPNHPEHWGGVETDTCGGPDQTIEVICSP